MGRNYSRYLFLLITLLLIVGSLMIFSKASHFQLQSSNWNTDSTEDKFFNTSAPSSKHSAPQQKWQNVNNPSNAPTVFENDYKPSTTLANNTVPPSEVRYPLVASTKFIGKKDKKKNKKDKKKQSIADKKSEGKSRRGYLSGLSASDDLSSHPTQPSTGATTPPPPAKNNQSQAKKEEEENLDTLDYWAKPIFIDQDITAVSKLISSYQGQKVSQNTFYGVVTEMRQDERVEVREFGVMALAATPSSRSFADLSLMKHTDPDAEIRTTAARNVASYTDVNRLGYVVSALNVPMDRSPKAAYEALVVLSEATKIYSDLQAFNENNPKPKSVDLNLIEPKFNQALSIIDSSLINSPDTKVKTQATQTSEQITKFLAI